jgi:cytochrome c oxidase subunit 3
LSARLGYAVEDDRLAVRGRTLVLGVILFLASELMFFAAWFAAYFDLRGQARQWPPPGVHLDPLEPGIGTVLLGLSSVLVIVATHAIRRTAYGTARLFLALAVACGIAFLALTAHEWSTNGFTFATHAYGSLHYGVTGFHAAHVTAGLFLLTLLAIGVRRPAFRGEHFAGAEAIGYYWHFVFVVWVGIYALLWFVR